MHGWSHNSIRKPQSPSFSSSLLDEIYRSMDVGDENSGEIKLREHILSRKHSVNGGGGGGEGGTARARSAMEDEGISSLRRAFLVSSLLESNRKPVMDDDLLFFGSVSSSLDSRSKYDCESESFCDESKWQKLSCFSPFRPNLVKNNVYFKKHQQMQSDYCSDNNHGNKIVHGTLIKSKARALKRVKQPISPGGRLTSFLINSLLINRHLKNSKDVREKKIERTSKSTHGSACSSASSFTKSSLSKNSPRSREKGIRRTVRFYPMSGIIDEDCRPCGEKFISARQDVINVHVTTMMSQNQFKNNEEDDDSDDDMTSDTSSDLFELDHLSILQDRDELPVYETTHFDTNCVIANGLIC